MIEARRKCGYRKVGGLYLCGEYIPVACDRLPYPLTVCPVCGQGIKVGRGFTRINPLKLFGVHHDCTDRVHPCFMCDPKDEAAYVMGVGQKFYTPDEFMAEAASLGVSKRIPFVPQDLKVGETTIYLAHPKACEVRESTALQQAMAIVGESQEEYQPRLLDAETVRKAQGIFTAFVPQRVEKLVWESELDAVREDLEKRGITPVPVPDGDLDHLPGGGS